MEQDANPEAEPVRYGPWPGRLDHVLALLWFGGFVVAASNVVMGLLPFLALAASGLVLAGIWGLRAVWWALIGFPARLGRRRRPLDRLAWLVLPAALALAIGLARLEVPLRIRFALSESALRAVGEPGRAGLFRVERILREDGLALLTTGTSFLDEYGLVRIPGGEPPESLVRDYRHLKGEWWAYVIRN